MSLLELPHFTVDAVSPAADDGSAIITGRFSHLRGVRSTRGYLYRLPGPSILGELDTVPVFANEAARFRTSDAAFAPELEAGAAYPWLDAAWEPHLLAMILGPAERWAKRSFSPSPVRYYLLDQITAWQAPDLPLPAGATDLGVHAGGWNRAECELCPEQLGGERSADGYVDPDGHWLCGHCFERYAVRHDVSFVSSER